MADKKRAVELLVLSDIHLGTYGCKAQELLNYLDSIEPKHVVLNGDIIDIWQFSKRYWPKSHMQVIRKILKYVAKGIPVDYVTGNHDEMLRKFVGFEMGSFKISNKVILNLNGNKTWIFHGDVFDVTMQHSKWLARLGAVGYDTLILINCVVNWGLEKFGREKYSFSKKVKNSVKTAVKFINNFEKIAAEIGIQNKYATVCCGHIHQPEKRTIKNEEGEILYLNSGDWVENCTALEYNNQQWSIYTHDVQLKHSNETTEEMLKVCKNNQELFKELVSEFGVLQREEQQAKRA